MKRRGLDEYRRPEYPVRGDAESDAAVGQHVPRRWRSGKVAGAMALFFFPLAGGPASADVCTPKSGGGAPSGDEKRKGGKPKVNIGNVFEHGEGRGAFGCVAVAPPAFLTEADARQVILEEFARVGVKFELDRKRLEGVRRKPELDVVIDGKEQDKKGEPLVLDGYDPVHNIGFEYISEGDYFQLGGQRSGSSVQDYDFKALAAGVRADAEKDGSVRLGVFYDPMARVDDFSGEHKKARELVRGQVRDFIAWLKAEGVL